VKLPRSAEDQNGDEHGSAHWQCIPVRVSCPGGSNVMGTRSFRGRKRIYAS
jgi:hypothetical protein